MTTVQDLGRVGFGRFGINPSGAMDRTAARLINILLGNDENEAVLEIHFPAPILQFEEPATIALGGADFAAHLNEKPIENWRPVRVEKGSVLEFRQRNFGARIYLSVSGGFQIPEWLGSRSTNLSAKIGGFDGRAFQKNDRLFFKERTPKDEQRTNFRVSRSLVPFYSRFPTVRVAASAEWEHLSEESRETFLSNTFSIRRESDRMGFRLAGENLNLTEKIELLSSAVNFGTIQLLPDGQLIILMADHQTTGGYPRVCSVAAIDLPLLAQLNPGDTVNFYLISINEAENLLVQQEIELNYLRTAVRFL
ncbi:MAG TPA: biotin-dependent carboxyltransferase family protein [Pyrinomonadaceae bacterium]|nr:biotin-dependent carboxyltransferase family protein [Pyrinomonadaceae bacterium]